MKSLDEHQIRLLERVATELSGIRYQYYGVGRSHRFRPVDVRYYDEPRFRLVPCAVPGEIRVVDERGTDVTDLFEAALERLTSQEELAYAS